jgi:AAA+ superfamily predicted ATPase
MADHDDTVRALREALQQTPNNLPLRQHLAELLADQGRFEEAETEYRQALLQGPDRPPVKLGLAETFYRLGKTGQALVVVEDLLRSPERPARALLLHARLLLRGGAVEEAVRQYRAAVSGDPALADTDLARQLGLAEGPGSEVSDGRLRMAREEPPVELGDADLARPPVTFQDVGGMEIIKEEIRLKIIYPLTHPELYRTYGKATGGGILLYGPPGCGKTHLARATAGEISADFLAVGINEVLDMWIGRSERNLHEFFEQARRRRPCVLFFDEVDALGANRGDLRSSYARNLINQFLAEMDGLQASNEGVLILAATNAPWHLDVAFRRPGRFDRVLFVPPPDTAARATILRLLCRDKPLRDLDPEAVARQTDGYSGADLKAVVDVAVERKLREALREGVPQPLTTRDLLDALAAARPSTREWFAAARNYALYSNQGGLYDDVLKYLKL